MPGSSQTEDQTRPLRYGADMFPGQVEATVDGKYAVLLRAVNVGGRNKIAMARLRELLEGLGYEASARRTCKAVTRC